MLKLEYSSVYILTLQEVIPADYRFPLKLEYSVYFAGFFNAMGAKTFNSGNAHVNPLKHSVLESISNLFWPV